MVEDMFPAGCRIFFSQQSHTGDGLLLHHDVLEARSLSVSNGACFNPTVFILDKDGKELRALNFRHIVMISPLETVGPANANH